MYVTTNIFRVEFRPIVSAQAGVDPEKPQIINIPADTAEIAVEKCREMVVGTQTAMKLDKKFELVSVNPLREACGSMVVLTLEIEKQTMRPASIGEMQHDGARQKQASEPISKPQSQPQELTVESVTRTEGPKA